MSRLGLGASNRRVADGVGWVRHRTIEVGGTVIAVANIGSVRFYAGEKNWGLAVVGAILAVVGLVQLDSGLIAWAFVLIGIALIIANALAKTELMLSIGTCDGRFTDIVSTDREFLMSILDLLQRKIDEDGSSLTASIDLNTRSISGTQ